MLETEEVDDDYFTPVASGSLANIFGKTSVIDVKSENESLKYTPPKAQYVSKQPEDPKATSCVFACVLVAYEWCNNTYLQKGKLGFAMIKVIKTGTHNMVLYDSNKSTLSNVSVSSKLKVNLKGTNYISYYDDKRNYWSLYGAQNEIKTITDLLKSLDVTIDTTTETDSKPPEPVTNKELQPLHEDNIKPVESDTDTSIHQKSKVSILNRMANMSKPPEPVTNKELQPLHEDNIKPVESDTDTSIHQKSKILILNRMANMGHSVLPPNAVFIDKTSDSSDTNETDYHIKAVRHKPVKGIIKKSNVDKTLADHKKIIDIHTSTETSRIGYNITDLKNIHSFTNDQLVPLVNTGIVNSSSGIDTNVFITEQRISNTELRINMNRMSDKLEHILSKISLLELKNQNERTAEINTEILHKLLGEYETKIKNYEDLFKQMGTDINTQNMTTPSNNKPILRNDDDGAFKNKNKDLEKTMKEKGEMVLMLQSEIQILKDTNQTLTNDLQSTTCELKAALNSEQSLLKDLAEANNKLTSAKSNVENKIKCLMNDTYQAVATNFENGETYSGESTKKIIAMVIKKVTISALNDS